MKKLREVTIQQGLREVTLKLAQNDFYEATIKPLTKPGDPHVYGYEVQIFDYVAACTLSYHRALSAKGDKRCGVCGLYIGPLRRRQ